MTRRGAAGGPVIEIRQVPGGTRVSTIRRPDGTTLTVRVPPAAMADEAEGGHWPESWIIGDGTTREPSPSALRRLASVVSGGPWPTLAPRRAGPAMAVR